MRRRLRLRALGRRLAAPATWWRTGRAERLQAGRSRAPARRRHRPRARAPL